MSNQRYLVTARKYRPQLFQEVVAQEHVTETLRNAILLDRLAHAYLFSGPRGVGKTTAARILAKAINCTTPEAQRPDAEPCRACDSCKSFEEGRNLNIIEIDAASNNKVEDIRELRDTVRIPPQGNRKKVYIIDEVHMLSNAAFNALLKTLEEPPPYVLFIFATTEPHKVLPTILSRCQRFDFRRIAVPEIIARLRDICTEEHITADEASLMLVARKGDGALRDALSVFDQSVSLCGTDLQYAALAQALGVVDVDLFFNVTQYVADRNSAGMIRLVEHIVRSGFDLLEFLDGLAEHLRNLLVARTMPDTELIEAAEATRARYAEAATGFTEPDLLRLVMIASAAEEAVRNSRQPRLRLELALLKMASLVHAADLRQALAKLDRIEAMAKAGKVNVVSEAPPPPAYTTAPPQAARPTPPPTIHEDAPPFDPDLSSAPAAAMPPLPLPETPIAEPQRVEEPDIAPAEDEAPPPPSRPRPQAPKSKPAPAPPPPALDFFGPPALQKKTPKNEATQPTASVTHSNGSAALAMMPDVSVATEASPLLRKVEETWLPYVRVVKAERIHVGSLLQHTAPVNAHGQTIMIAVPDDFHQRLLGNQEAYLLQHLKSMVDASIDKIQFVIRADILPGAKEEAPVEFDPHAYMQQKSENNPVLRAIFEQFGGEIVW